MENKYLKIKFTKETGVKTDDGMFFYNRNYIEWLEKQLNTECNHNSQRDKLNYLKWFEFADNEIDKGRTQKRCEKCFKWLFPSSFILFYSFPFCVFFCS